MWCSIYAVNVYMPVVRIIVLKGLHGMILKVSIMAFAAESYCLQTVDVASNHPSDVKTQL